MDRTLRGLGSRATPAPAAKPSAVEQLLGGDSTKRGAPSPTAPPRTAARPGGGILTGLIQSAGAVAGTATPGEYVVPRPPFRGWTA